MEPGTLPPVELPSESVDVEGFTVEIRALSRGQALQLKRDYGDDPESAEAFIVSCGTGVKLDEAQAWLDATPILVAGKVIDGILALSGLTETPDPN